MFLHNSRCISWKTCFSTSGASFLNTFPFRCKVGESSLHKPSATSNSIMLCLAASNLQASEIHTNTFSLSSGSIMSCRKPFVIFFRTFVRWRVAYFVSWSSGLASSSNTWSLLVISLPSDMLALSYVQNSILCREKHGQFVWWGLFHGLPWKNYLLLYSPTLQGFIFQLFDHTPYALLVLSALERLGLYYKTVYLNKRHTLSALKPCCSWIKTNSKILFFGSIQLHKSQTKVCLHSPSLLRTRQGQLWLRRPFFVHAFSFGELWSLSLRAYFKCCEMRNGFVADKPLVNSISAVLIPPSSMIIYHLLRAVINIYRIKTPANNISWKKYVRAKSIFKIVSSSFLTLVELTLLINFAFSSRLLLS